MEGFLLSILLSFNLDSFSFASAAEFDLLGTFTGSNSEAAGLQRTWEDGAARRQRACILP